MTLDEAHAEENFDLALLGTCPCVLGRADVVCLADTVIIAVSLEKDVLPHLGGHRVPDTLIRRLGKALQRASKLYELDLPELLSHDVVRPDDADDTETLKDDRFETRFDGDFDRLATGDDLFGTTAEVVAVGRERFAYWCFDLLWLMASDVEHGESFSAFFSELGRSC